MKKDLRDLTHEETRTFANELGVEPYRGDQIFRWVHGRRVSRVESMTDLGKELRERVTNLVFMGMGEPLHNYKNVLRALEILTDPTGADFSRRRITVSTAGLVPGIEKLAAETRTQLRVNLAVSLNATTDPIRDVLMPINKKWNIARLIEAVRTFPLEKRRRVTFEY